MYGGAVREVLADILDPKGRNDTAHSETQRREIDDFEAIGVSPLHRRHCFGEDRGRDTGKRADGLNEVSKSHDEGSKGIKEGSDAYLDRFLVTRSPVRPHLFAVSCTRR